MTNNDDIKLVEKLRESRDTIYYELGKQIIGQKQIIEHIIIALLCKSHALVIGVPGLAKTLLIKTLSESLPTFVPSNQVASSLL